MEDARGKGIALGAEDYLVKPVRRDDILATLRRAMVGRAVANGKCKVLAIDDDSIALELIDATLGAEGFAVTRALGGRDGLAKALEEHPALIVVDLLMPEMDGFAVIEQLRMDPETAGIPVVVLTSQVLDRADKERLNQKISHLATKGEFNRAEFTELVRRLCMTEAQA
jgi:CheY-like chemotaxis protein